MNFHDQQLKLKTELAVTVAGLRAAEDLQREQQRLFLEEARKPVVNLAVCRGAQDCFVVARDSEAGLRKQKMTLEDELQFITKLVENEL